MRILVTSLPDLPKINPQRAHHILNYLSKKHDITLLCINAWWLKELNDPFLKKSLENIKIDYFSKRKLNPVVQEVLAGKNIKNLNLELDSFDIHINFNSLIAGFKLSKKVEAPTVFDICDDLIDWISISPQIPNIIKPIGKKTGYFMIKRNINASNKITCSLESLRDAYKIPIEKTNIIPNGVDTNLFKCNKENNIREKWNIPENTFLLGFVGFLGNWINLEPTFKVIRLLKDKYNIKLLIVGDGDNLLKYKRLSERLGIIDSIIFTGNVNYQDVPKYISSMDVCLLPFDASNVSQGALPIKLFEYMACEKPVISSHLINVKNIVEDLVIFAENSELEKKIIEFYNDENLRINMGKNGRIFVKNKYGWESICNKFEKTLIKTIEEQ